MALYTSNNNKLSKKEIKKSNKFSQKSKILFGLILLILLIGGLFGKSYVSNKVLDNSAGQFQKYKGSGAVRIQHDFGAYNSGENVSSLKQLRKYRDQPGYLHFRGYIAVPKQNGVTVPITSMQINEGSSKAAIQNKAMSYGAVTDKSNQIFGESGNTTLAAHSFQNGRQFFSPMNNGINVNQRPKIYITDGNKLFIYQLNKGIDDKVVSELDKVKDYDDPRNIPGMRIVDKSHGSISNDSVAKGKAILTMYTCDERGIFNINPQNRIVMTAMLDETKDLSQATDWEKSLFPQLN